MPRNFSLILVFCLGWAGWACAEEQASASTLVLRYPTGSIVSLAAAEQALEQAQKARAHEDAQHRVEEQACYPKFFTASCLEAVRERHRFGLLKIRQVELEANAFKRRARVEEREQALKERQAPAPEPQISPDERILRHEAKLKQLEDEEAARAAKRSSNIAAYEKKQREAEERQREFAKRKAEKDSQSLK